MDMVLPLDDAVLSGVDLPLGRGSVEPGTLSTIDGPAWFDCDLFTVDDTGAEPLLAAEPRRAESTFSYPVVFLALFLGTLVTPSIECLAMFVSEDQET